MHETSARTWCTGKTQRDRVEREMGGGPGWGIHVYPWLIPVNVWQKPLQYCKVISLQLIKKKREKKKNFIDRAHCTCSALACITKPIPMLLLPPCDSVTLIFWKFYPPAFMWLTPFLFSSVQFSRSGMSDCEPHEQQHARPPSPSPTPGVHPNPCPLSQWCHPTISSSVVSFTSCPQSFPVSGSFQMSQFFTSDVQSIGVSASPSVLPMNTQDCSPLGWTCWISLQSKGLSGVFSNTTVQKHQFFGAQLSL